MRKAVALRLGKPRVVAHVSLLFCSLRCCALLCCVQLSLMLAKMPLTLPLALLALVLTARIFLALLLRTLLLCCEPLSGPLSGCVLLCALLSGCLLDGAVDCRSLGNAEERSHVVHSPNVLCCEFVCLLFTYRLLVPEPLLVSRLANALQVHSFRTLRHGIVYSEQALSFVLFERYCKLVQLQRFRLTGAE